MVDRSATIPVLIEKAEEGGCLMDVLTPDAIIEPKSHETTIKVAEYKNRSESLELLLVNATKTNLLYEDQDMEIGEWFFSSSLPLKIASGKASKLYLASTAGQTSIAGGLRYRIESAGDKWLFLGFKNPQANVYKNFINVTSIQSNPAYGYDNAKDNETKDILVDGYHVQCSIQSATLSPFNTMFQYVIYEE